MNSRSQYIFLVSICVLTIAMLLVYVFRDSRWMIILAELFLVLIVVYAVHVYQQLFRPINLLKQGINALKDKDFNMQFASTGSPDMDELIDLYNQLMTNLRNERILQQEQHYFLERLLEALPISVLILDYDNQLIQYNSQAEQLLDLSATQFGKGLEELAHPLVNQINLNDFEPKTIKLGSAAYYRVVVNRFMYRGFAQRFVIIEELTSEIAQTERQAYGKVIRMMAHEVNNTIGAVNSILQSLLSGQEMPEEELREYLPVILDRNEQMNVFMKNFAKVVRLPQPTFSPVNVNDLLQNILKLFSVSFQEQQIELVNQIDSKDYVLNADAAQLQQVFVNVIQNAIDASNESPKITVNTDASKQLIEVIDNGTGIAQEHQNNLFTPFFSTKTTGQGIGLTITKEILMNHGFQFDLYSRNGQTIFKIRT